MHNFNLMTVFCATIHPLRRSIVVKKRNASSILESFAFDGLLYFASPGWILPLTKSLLWSLVVVNIACEYRVPSIAAKKKSQLSPCHLSTVCFRPVVNTSSCKGIVCQADAPNPKKCIVSNGCTDFHTQWINNGVMCTHHHSWSLVRNHELPTWVATIEFFQYHCAFMVLQHTT